MFDQVKELIKYSCAAKIADRLNTSIDITSIEDGACNGSSIVGEVEPAVFDLIDIWQENVK